MSEHAHDANEGLLHRLVNFSDAVFAIILTLLALELRPPPIEHQAELADALVAMAPHFFAFVMSFGVLGIFWLGHMATLRKTIRFDWALAILNLLLLFALSLMPFVSGLVGEFGAGGLAWQIYCAVLAAAGLVQVVLLTVHLRDEGRLVGGLAKGEYAHRLIRAASPGLAFGTGLVLSLVGQPVLSGYCWVLFAPIFLIARLIRPRPAKAATPPPAPLPAAAAAASADPSGR